MKEKGGKERPLVRDARVEPYLYKSRSRQFLITLRMVDQCLPALYPKEQVDIQLSMVHFRVLYPGLAVATAC
jgi:hypothetical protein